jgi:outer membrane protein assembly factor BamB
MKSLGVALCSLALVLMVASGASAAPSVPSPAGHARLVSGAAAATTHVKLSLTSGPPTGTVTVSGSGFGAAEAVDVYFDTTDEALTVTSATGAFSGVKVSVPASAVPGAHWVTAAGRHSGLAAQAKFTVNTNWSQYRYSSLHKGSNPYENVLNPGNVGTMDQAWHYTTGGAVDSSAAVLNGVVFAGSQDGFLHAVNAATGAQEWSAGVGGPINASPAVTPDGSRTEAFVGSENGNVYALAGARAQLAQVLWTFPTGAAVESSPTLAGGVVYVGSDNDTVYAINAGTGQSVWSFTTTGPVNSSPTVANGVVYVGSDGGIVYALNAATGAELWSFDTVPVAATVSSPAVASGVVYVGVGNGEVFAIDAATGVQLWSYATASGAGKSGASSPAVAGGVVYVGSASGVYAFNAATGTVLWNGGPALGSVTVANGVVYSGSAFRQIYALSAATGAVLWSYATGGAVASSPAVANGVVYTGSNDGNIYAFDLSAGQGAPARPARSALHPDNRLRPQRCRR